VKCFPTIFQAAALSRFTGTGLTPSPLQWLQWDNQLQRTHKELSPQARGK